MLHNYANSHCVILGLLTKTDSFLKNVLIVFNNKKDRLDISEVIYFHSTVFQVSFFPPSCGFYLFERPELEYNTACVFFR